MEKKTKKTAEKEIKSKVGNKEEKPVFKGFESLANSNNKDWKGPEIDLESVIMG
jgi:hypothetical protein